MENIYIATYFNPYNYQKKKQLAQEFIIRYPWVHLLQTGNEIIVKNNNQSVYPEFADSKEFIIYKLINRFIEQNKYRIKSLTIIDSDLILENNFRQKVEAAFSSFIPNYPLVLQGFSTSREVDGINLYGPIQKSFMYNYRRNFPIRGGHTGYIWCYTKEALNILYPFPEYFIIGGFDYILALCLKEFEGEIRSLITDNLMLENVLKFYEKIQNGKVGSSFIFGTVLHNFHGDKRNRINQWKLYNKGLTPEIVENYYKGRNEDQPIEELIN